MIALPVVTNNTKEVAKLYGNVELFAFYDESNNSYEIVKNEAKGNGIKTGEFLVNNNVTKTIYIHLGKGPFNKMIEGGIEVYYLGKEPMNITKAIELLKEKKLTQVTKENADELLDPGQVGGCSCGCEEEK